MNFKIPEKYFTEIKGKLRKKKYNFLLCYSQYFKFSNELKTRNYYIIFFNN